MAERTFTLFHLSLVPIQQLTFDTFSGSREEWIRHALAEPFTFPHWGGSDLYWTPYEPLGETIFGVIQRTQKHERHKPPTEGGEEVVVDEWQGAYVLIDPTHHDEGQRAAVENDVVGEPQALLKSLVTAMNNRGGKPYHVEVEPLFDASRFWAFSERHANVLRYVKFSFIVPNMWGTESDLEKDLKDTGAQTNSQRVEVGFHSEDGVLTKNQKVRDGVDYAEKGAGTVRAKSMEGHPFSSTKKRRITRIPAGLGGLEVMRGLFGNLKARILGREQNPPVDDTDRTGDGPAGN